MAKQPTGFMMIYIVKSCNHGELMLMLIINLLTIHISRYVCRVVSVGTISRQSVGHIVDGKNPTPLHMSNIHQKTSTNQRLNRFNCCYIVSIPASSITSSFTESLITPKHDMQQHPYCKKGIHTQRCKVLHRSYHSNAFSSALREKRCDKCVLSLVSKLYHPKQSQKHWVLHGFGNTSNPSTDELDHWQKWAICMRTSTTTTTTTTTTTNTSHQK